MMNTYMYTQETRFAESSEMVNVTSRIHLNRENQVGGIPVISNGETLYVDGADSNNLILADPGSGKSRRVAAPLVLACASAGYSMIINDPKAEIIRNTKAFLEKRDYNIKILNMRDPSSGDAFNPLYFGAKLYKEGRADAAKEEFTQLAETLYAEVHSEKDPFFEIMAEQLFVSYCLIACREVEPEKVTLPFIYRLFVEGEEKLGGQTVLKDYLKRVDDTILYESVAGYVNAASETKASILSVFSSVLSKLVINECIGDLISNHTMDPLDLVHKKTAIFIIPRDEVGVYNSLVTGIIDQIYSRLLLEAEKTGGTLKRRCEFIIDEFSNLTPLHCMDNKISECRSRNIRMSLFVQSYDQLISRYKEIAPVITSCCQNLFYLHTPENKILESISLRCGTYISEFTHERRRLLSVSELQHFDKESGQALVLLNRCYPYVTNLPDISVYMTKLGFNVVESYKKKERTRFRQSEFSIKEFVQEKKNAEMEELLGKKSEIPPFWQESTPFCARESVSLKEEAKELDKIIEKRIKELKDDTKKKTAENEDSSEEMLEISSLQEFLENYSEVETFNKEQMQGCIAGMNDDRENAMEIYKCAEKYEYKELFSALFGRFKVFLSTEEIEALKKRYMDIFFSDVQFEMNTE